MKSYDLIIIGGGAGLKLARPLANQGKKIAVIEGDRLGGTCLNRGCIPSKMLIHPADLIEKVKHCRDLDLDLKGELVPIVSDLVPYVSKVVDNESDSLIPLMENQMNLDYYPCRAQFVDHQTIKVNEETIQANRIVIAVGAKPAIPMIEGLKETPFLTSKELLRLKTLPKSITILGAGYTACELAHYLDAMGVDVQFIVRSKFLKEADESIQAAFQSNFTKRFQVYFASPHKVAYLSNGFEIHMDQQIIKSEALLVATGVEPNTMNLGLDKTEVSLDKKGYIQVDDYLETTQKGIYAFGDVIGRYQFRHTANFEGEYLLEQMFNEKKQKITYPPIPHAVFTYPQIGAVGKTERELKEEKREIIIGINRYEDSAMGMALRSKEGLVKLLFDRRDKKLLGAHIFGEEASNMVHMLIAYMNMNATLDDLLKTIYIHPALNENIRNAARNAKKQC
jgi:mycothione reductase